MVVFNTIKVEGNVCFEEVERSSKREQAEGTSGCLEIIVKLKGCMLICKTFSSINTDLVPTKTQCSPLESS